MILGRKKIRVWQCSLGGLPQYEPWSNFASGWLILEGMPLTYWSSDRLIESRLDYFRLTEFCRDFSTWLSLIDVISKRLIFLLSTESSNILTNVIKRSVLPLLNRGLRRSTLSLSSSSSIYVHCGRSLDVRRSLMSKTSSFWKW